MGLLPREQTHHLPSSAEPPPSPEGFVQRALSPIWLAVHSQLNQDPRRRPLHVEAQLLASEITACTEVTSPLSEVQINRSTEVITLEDKHLVYHLQLKLSSTLLSDHLNEWGKG